VRFDQTESDFRSKVSRKTLFKSRLCKVIRGAKETDPRETKDLKETDLKGVKQEAYRTEKTDMVR